VGLHAEGRTQVVRESRHLEEVNESFEQIEKGQVDARLVFDLR
jgi:propanol-preferring alcohol dehydrogenase